MNGGRLCVFTRYPEPGTTKTRLIPALGSVVAASLQRDMTAHVLDVAGQLEDTCGIRVEVRFEGGDETRMRDMFGDAFVYRSQGDGNLGNRMRRCFLDHFAAGGQRVVVVGADVPGVDAGVFSSAFNALRDHDLVIGPASDGGYYLIGLRADVSEIFEKISWGTEHVLRQTLGIAACLGLSVFTLTTLADVDRPSDLQVVEDAWGKARLVEAVDQVSVIIPTLNETSRIKRTLSELRVEDPTVEVIVADGGSTDDTVQKAEVCGGRVVITKPGRARQMNGGAAIATGNILLFLHADTRLPGNFPALVRSSLGEPGVAAGAFQFRLDAKGRAYRMLERLVNWRSHVLQMPYGDQALFMKARTFSDLGGFPDTPIMEDFDMVRGLKNHGRISIVSASAVTSARRWQRRGILRTTIINQLVIIGHLLGIPAQTLSRLYRGLE